MDRPRIERLSIKNFACIKDATFELAQFSALIGPNDSGKSMVLRALRLLTLFAAGKVPESPADYTTLDQLVESHSKTDTRFDVKVSSETWRVEVLANGLFRELAPSLNQSVSLGRGQKRWTDGSDGLVHLPGVRAVANGSLLVRIEPDVLRLPSTLIAPGQPIAFDERGQGLAGILDAIRDRSDGSFEAISDSLRALFPAVKFLQLRSVSNSEKALQLELKDGTRVPANLISEGILYFLAFAAIERIDRPAVLLVEEPENGLHPSRIKDVMAVLRRISERTQVVIATHSPLVINEMKGDEVVVLTRDETKGTQARLLKDTYNYEERSRVYQNGELWLSYANGRDEQALLTKPETPK